MNIPKVKHKRRKKNPKSENFPIFSLKRIFMRNFDPMPMSPDILATMAENRLFGLNFGAPNCGYFLGGAPLLVKQKVTW